MENEEFQRLVLVALAEMVDLLGELTYPTPYRSIGGRHRAVADALRVASEGGEDAQDARIRHAGSR